MSTDRDIAKLAALFAAGLIVEDELLELLGEESLVNEVVALAGATVVTGAAKGIIEDTVDVGLDIVDSVNPFKW